ncbi:hypothetical protein CCM_08542 [Cordyceps militaris CM01]|uniref:Uncharacterized protein n=1 Tax=Cordyceps militaris (strain CM01) TaxID=983644 RepID=G3JRE8_CORMM|nr:uncharacterized protein CCM_08542 [Cordyceps militaris CM01]EGX88498.1 hypothetical protein CCM_08542 [Cordyceps militaris CM01]
MEGGGGKRPIWRALAHARNAEPNEKGDKYISSSPENKKKRDQSTNLPDKKNQTKKTLDTIMPSSSMYSSLDAAQDVARGACIVAWPADEPYTEPTSSNYLP